MAGTSPPDRAADHGGPAPGSIRVFIVTVDEPVYAPRYLAKLIDRMSHPVVGIATLPVAGRKGRFGLLFQRLAMYGPRDFVIALWMYGSRKIKGLAVIPRDRRRYYSVRRLAEHHGIPIHATANVNGRPFLERLRASGAEVVISVAANQIFGRELLNIPRLGCLNVHSSLLPKYRGMDGLFWALVHGETQVGVTVHCMAEGIDDGPIVAQEAFEVEPTDTLHALYLRAIDVGSRLVAGALERIARGNADTKPNQPIPGQYFSWPTREAGRRLRRQGRRFF